MKNIKEIEIHPDELKALGEKILTFVIMQFPDPVSTKQLLLAIETLKAIAKIMTDQLAKEGVNIAYRREERT